jgi:hypothetical protein
MLAAGAAARRMITTARGRAAGPWAAGTAAVKTPYRTSRSRPIDDRNSVTTRYIPQQLHMPYRVRPLLGHGIDGRRETMALPEPAVSKLSPHEANDLRQEFTSFDRPSSLPVAQLPRVQACPPDQTRAPLPPHRRRARTPR